MTFSVLFTICSWLTAFSCFCLWLLKGSEFHHFTPILRSLLLQLMVIVWNSFPFTFIRRWSPTGAAADQQHEVAPTAPHALNLQLSERDTAENPTNTQMQLINLGEESLLVVCCNCYCFERQNKATQPRLREHQNSNAEFLSISPPWSNTQQFALLLISH